MSDKVKPTMHLLHGFIGSGKTTFARQLERETGAIRFTHDEWMIREHGWNPPEKHYRKYFAEIEQLIWNEAAEAVKQDADVILDFGFWSRASRDNARSRALRIGATPTFYSISCSTQIMRKRAMVRSKTRSTDSLWIDGPGFDKLFKDFEPVHDDEECVHLDGQSQNSLIHQLQSHRT